MRGDIAQGARPSLRPSQHESFIAYARYRYLGLAVLLCAASIALYIGDRPYGTRYGGTWAGYILGIAGAALIVWLTWYGYRKRSYAGIAGRLAERLSAHVYFGLALLVVATLHTGFHFGWNVHTIAYGLMCGAIASGIVGAFCYARYPRLMTENRAGMTMQQMLGAIVTLDEQLRDRTVRAGLDERAASIIERAVETSAIGGSVWRQLTGRYPDCPTAAAIVDFAARANEIPRPLETAWSEIRVLLNEKSSLLARVRRDIRYKALLDIWLHMHVPLSFMLIAALIAHILSIFMLW